MTIKELAQILSHEYTALIIRKILHYGYKDAEHDEKYKNFSVATIIKGDQESTGWITSPNGKYEFCGRIYRNVEGAANAEFIAVSMNRIDKKKDLSVPYSILWFVKEAQK